MQSQLHFVAPDVMGFDPRPALFVECVKRIPPLFLPNAVLHDFQHGNGQGKGGVVLKSLVRFHISLPMSRDCFCGFSSQTGVPLRACLSFSRSPTALSRITRNTTRSNWSK